MYALSVCACVLCARCVRVCVCVCEDHYFRSAKTATVLFLSRLNRSTCSRLHAMVITHMLTISVLNARFGCVLTSMFKNAKCMFMIAQTRELTCTKIYTILHA